MPAKKGPKRAARNAKRLIAKSSRHRIPISPPGTPSGIHLAGLKGSKVDSPCFCGGCSPKAKANHGRPVMV